MEQIGQQIFELISQYGYWGMLPLMIIEGPVATLAAAILASLGAFNWFLVLFFSITGDVVGDVALYAVGRKYGMSFVNGWGKYMGINKETVTRMEKYFEDHGGKTIFAVKSTVGLCWAAFIAAGITNMKFSRFLKYSFLGGVFWSGFLVAMGYFYGYLWREISQYIDWIGWAIGGVAILSYFAITLYRKKEFKDFFKKQD